MPPKGINTQKFETELNRTSTDSLVNVDVLSARVKDVVNGQMEIAQSLQDLQQRISLIATKKELDSFKKKLDDGLGAHEERLQNMDRRLKAAARINEGMPELTKLGTAAAALPGGSRAPRRSGARSSAASTRSPREE